MNVLKLILNHRNVLVWKREKHKPPFNNSITKFINSPYTKDVGDCIVGCFIINYYIQEVYIVIEKQSLTSLASNHYKGVLGITIANTKRQDILSRAQIYNLSCLEITKISIQY